VSYGLRHQQSFDESPEDILPKAGWMYADLFLALTVIFLATISFVPEFGKVGVSNTLPNSTVGVETATSFNYSKGFTLLVPVDKYDQVPAKISDFLKQEKLGSATEIIFVQLIGGYDEKFEKPNDGQLRAITFAVEVNKRYPQLFLNAQRFIESSSKISPANVALRITFARALPTK
jgi:hypothetical protein